MCDNDRKAADCLDQRRDTIKIQFIPSLTSDNNVNAKDYVWVPTQSLLQFMSCSQRGLPSIDELKMSEHMCTHERPGLHPRVARQGKLIPQVSFDLYVATLLEEELLVSDRNLSGKGKLAFPAISANTIACQDCCIEYKRELEETLTYMNSLCYLYDELDLKECGLSLEMDTRDETGTGEFAFVVSRKFVKLFREKFSRFLKKSQTSLANATFEKLESTHTRLAVNNVADGLDGLDISELGQQNTDREQTDELNVNGSLTCKFYSKLNMSILFVQLKV